MRSSALLAMLSSLAAAESDDLTLKRAFAGRFELGVALPTAPLREEENKLAFTQFGALTAENCMKPGPLQPTEGRFAFEAADRLVALALDHGLQVHGHTLVWHQQCPDWFFVQDGQPATPERVRERLRAHIRTVVQRYAGKVKTWDVVNEALSDGKEYLRPTPWLAALGEDYLAEAFHAAHEADPTAELFYNDYNIELPEKREKALRLIRELRRRGAPVHGIGIQGHWQLDHIPFAEIEKSLIAFHAEGLKIMITELDFDVVPRRQSGAATDVREEGQDLYPNGLPPELLERQAQQYARLFALFDQHHDKIHRVTFWGLHDGRTWLNGWPYKRTNHPLFWDRQLQAKPALAAVLAVAGQGL